MITTALLLLCGDSGKAGSGNGVFLQPRWVSSEKYE
jgi:hypothetical protein